MKYTLNNILFLDIETAPLSASYNDLDERSRKLWDNKSSFLAKQETDTPEVLYDRAGIYAEFGKIICIGCGFITQEGNVKKLRIKSFYNDDEKKLLLDFKNMLETSFNDDSKQLCAHNGKEFDFPYIARRMLINGIKIPLILNMSGKKPWEIQHLDTLDLWKFGDYKNYASLDLLTHIFNIPTPKNDINGSQVASVYWNDNDLQRIVTYCQKDVVALVNVFLRLQCETIIDDNNIIFLT
jgi:hypothetical protein